MGAFRFRRTMMRTWFACSLLVLLAVSASAQSELTADKVFRPKSGAPPSLVPTGAPTPSAADAAKIAEVLAFEKEMEDAAVRGDVKTLERGLSPDFLFTHGDGWITGGAPIKVDTKATWLEYVAKRPTPYIYRDLDHVQVELHGDVALTIGRYLYLPRPNNPRP